MTRVGFVGAGQMGLPMVRRLVAAGHEVVAYARRAEVRDEIVAAGAVAVGDAGDAVAEADAVVVCLFADGQVRDLAGGPDGFLARMRPGALLINHVTGSPSTARWLTDTGGPGTRVVEAPVSGAATDIDAGRLTVLLAGDPEDLEAATPLLSAYADPVLVVGPFGSAMAVKLLNNALFAAHLQLAGEVERVAAEFGVDMATVAPAILASSGTSYAMGVVARSGSTSVVAERAGHFLHKDVAVVDAAAEELGLDLGVLGHVNREGPLTFRPRAGD